MLKSRYTACFLPRISNLTVAGDSIQEIESNMNSDRADVNQQLLANKLSLNVVKTEFMLVGSAKKVCSVVVQPHLEIDHFKIKQLCYTSVLGVEIDENYRGINILTKLPKKLLEELEPLEKSVTFFIKKPWYLSSML